MCKHTCICVYVCINSPNHMNKVIVLIVFHLRILESLQVKEDVLACMYLMLTLPALCMHHYFHVTARKSETWRKQTHGEVK